MLAEMHTRAEEVSVWCGKCGKIYATKVCVQEVPPFRKKGESPYCSSFDSKKEGRRKRKHEFESPEQLFTNIRNVQC